MNDYSVFLCYFYQNGLQGICFDTSIRLPSKVCLLSPIEIIMLIIVIYWKTSSKWYAIFMYSSVGRVCTLNYCERKPRSIVQQVKEEQVFSNRGRKIRSRGCIKSSLFSFPHSCGALNYLGVCLSAYRHKYLLLRRTFNSISGQARLVCGFTCLNRV